MTDSNFQEGVGQKIVEALKQQDESAQPAATVSAKSSAYVTEPETLDFETPDNDFSNLYTTSAEPKESFTATFDTAQLKSFNKEEEIFTAPTTPTFQSAPSYNDVAFQSVNQQKQPSNPANMHMPPNVDVLRRLITQLPSGVTKQTGAQIIRQTMEALGISMNNVLHEAQQVQDGLNDSVKTCMYSIQEYKNNIKQLEKQVLDYQKQIAYLNDLISLFVMTDKSR